MIYYSTSIFPDNWRYTVYRVRQRAGHVSSHRYLCILKRFFSTKPKGYLNTKGIRTPIWLILMHKSFLIGSICHVSASGCWSVSNQFFLMPALRLFNSFSSWVFPPQICLTNKSLTKTTSWFLGQHVALNRSSARGEYVGIICTSTNIKETVQEAADNAKYICEAYYGIIELVDVCVSF